MPEDPNVILGGGVAAGYAALEYAKRGGEPGRLVIVTADDRPPYDRPALSKEVMQGEEEATEARIAEEGFWAEHGIEVRTNTRVLAVDLGGRRLETADGETIPYGRLLVATGSRLRYLDVPGARDLAGVFHLRTATDVEEIVSAAGDAAKAVVVGGSFIGSEVAASLRQRGLDVTLVYMEDRLLGRLLPPELSAMYEAVYRDRGVELVPGETVARLEGEARLDRVVLASGREIDADLLVAGIGVVPQTEIFEGTGLEIDDGIVVDDHLRTGVESVWAAGDVARWPDPVFGRLRRVEHWDCAKSQGEHWARAVTGADEPFDYLTYFFSDAFDLSWEYWGDQAGANRVALRGSPADKSVSAWWLKDGRVVAAFVLDRPDEERDAAQALIRSGETVDPDRLADEDAQLPTG